MMEKAAGTGTARKGKYPQEVAPTVISSPAITPPAVAVPGGWTCTCHFQDKGGFNPPLDPVASILTNQKN